MKLTFCPASSVANCSGILCCVKMWQWSSTIASIHNEYSSYYTRIKVVAMGGVYQGLQRAEVMKRGGWLSHGPHPWPYIENVSWLKYQIYIPQNGRIRTSHSRKSANMNLLKNEGFRVSGSLFTGRLITIAVITVSTNLFAVLRVWHVRL